MADDIRVNADAWNNLAQDQQEAIHRILSQSGLAGNVVADPNAPEPQAAGAGLQMSGGLCKALCDIASTAAQIACAALPAPAQPVCIAAANAGAALCKSKCK